MKKSLDTFNEIGVDLWMRVQNRCIIIRARYRNTLMN